MPFHGGGARGGFAPRGGGHWGGRGWGGRGWGWGGRGWGWGGLPIEEAVIEPAVVVDPSLLQGPPPGMDPSAQEAAAGFLPDFEMGRMPGYEMGFWPDIVGVAPGELEIVGADPGAYGAYGYGPQGPYGAMTGFMPDFEMGREMTGFMPDYEMGYAPAHHAVGWGEDWRVRDRERREAWDHQHRFGYGGQPPPPPPPPPFGQPQPPFMPHPQPPFAPHPPYGPHPYRPW